MTYILLNDHERCVEVAARVRCPDSGVNRGADMLIAVGEHDVLLE